MFRDFSFLAAARPCSWGMVGGPWPMHTGSGRCSIFAMRTTSNYLPRLASAARRVQGPRSGTFRKLDTEATAYHPRTPHEASGRRPSNGRQGAGQQVRPPGTEHPPRDDLAAREVHHLNHLVPLSSSRVELLLQLRPRVPAAPFSTELALSSVDGLRRQGTQGRR